MGERCGGGGRECGGAGRGGAAQCDRADDRRDASHDDPRFQQSQLLDMLKQMDAGGLRLGEGGLRGAAKPEAKAGAQPAELEAAWGEAGAAAGRCRRAHP